jgi:hypothetical protein
MKPIFTLRMASSVSVLLAAGLVGTPAHSETDQVTSLLEALSLVSGRMLAAPGVSPEVTNDGDKFHVHIPLPKLTSPPNASVEVTATALRSGVWDITGLTLPPAGTLVTHSAPDAPPVSIRYTIGQQVAHGRVDPTLMSPSAYAIALSDLAFHIESAAPPSDLTIGQVTSDGTISGGAGTGNAGPGNAGPGNAGPGNASPGNADGRMTTQSRTQAENWHLTGTTRTGSAYSLSLKSADMHYAVDGLDRAQAERLRETVKAIAASQQAAGAVPGQPATIPPAVREQLRALIGANPGLLSGFDVADTLRDLHFESADGTSGDVGEIHIAIGGGGQDSQASGHLDLDLHDMTLAGVPAAYAPRLVAMKAAFGGIPAEALRQWLQRALEDGADPAALETQAVGLLNQPGARAGIDTMSIKSGPLTLQGSAQLRPTADGSAAVDIHLTAFGLDAMLTLIASDPKVRQITPILFLAKGIGKPDGDGMDWDIRLANGVVTVNGISMGQRSTRAPASRAPGGVVPGGGVPGGGVPGGGAAGSVAPGGGAPADR